MKNWKTTLLGVIIAALQAFVNTQRTVPIEQNATVAAIAAGFVASKDHDEK